MQLRAPAIVCASRAHGETAAIARLLTAEAGLVGAWVPGGRGRQLRPVLLPGNLVDADLRARAPGQLPNARIELLVSRGPWLSEPLPAAAIGWVTALTASALPEHQPFPALFEALSALLDAITVSPSAWGWAMALLSYEVLLLRELGFGVPVSRPDAADWPAILSTFDRLAPQLARNPLAHCRTDVMAARDSLRARLARIEGS